MRGTIRAAASALASVFVFAVAACAQPAPTRTSPAPSESASIISKTDLTSQARIVYEHYLDAVESISEHGNKGVDVIRPYLTADAYKSEVESFQSLDEAGLHTTGATKLVKFEAQSVDIRARHVIAYACVDLSDVKVINSKGDDVTPKSRPNRQTSLPSFGIHDGVIQLEENGTWSGASIC